MCYTIGADVGKFKTKIKWKGGQNSHLSKVASYREVRDNVVLDENNVVIEYENHSYIVGDLAEREGQTFYNSQEIYKSTLVTELNLLIALSRLASEQFNIVVGNPFSINTEKERRNLKERLSGSKRFIVNGKHYEINIRNVGVCPEGLASFYSENSLADDLNLWDFGSSTIHGITIRKRKLVDKRSHSFDFGFESLLDPEYGSLMHSLKAQMEKRWNDGNHKILCVGGKAPDMFNYVVEQYPHSSVTIHRDYQFSNAIGLFNLGVIAFEKSEANR